MSHEGNQVDIFNPPIQNIWGHDPSQLIDADLPAIRRGRIARRGRVFTQVARTSQLHQAAGQCIFCRGGAVGVERAGGMPDKVVAN